MSIETDLIEPVEFFKPGACPVCHAYTLLYHQAERTIIAIDKHALPKHYQTVIDRPSISCINCGYKGEVGQDFIVREDGSYKFVTEAGKIYEEERMANLPPVTHLHAEGNPFIDEYIKDKEIEIMEF